MNKIINYSIVNFDDDCDVIEACGDTLMKILRAEGGTATFDILVDTFLNQWNQNDIHNEATIGEVLKKIIKTKLIKKHGVMDPIYTLTKRADEWFYFYDRLGM
jgi:hypothetical protein